MEAVTVYIDHCVWDLFFKLGLDISVELPKEEYNLCITREAEFEIRGTPDTGKNGEDKKPFKKFIKDTMAKRAIRTDAYFGFGDPSLPPEEQRCGGFGSGRFISYKEISFKKELNIKSGATKKPATKLYKKEADISLAGHSIHSVVITLNNKKKEPFYIARQKGGKVVFLNDFESSGMTLKDFIKKQL